MATEDAATAPGLPVSPAGRSPRRHPGAAPTGASPPPARDARAPGGAGQHERALELLERFGRNPASFVIRYPAAWRCFESTRVEGAACYLEAHRTAVVWADPLCAPEDTPALLDDLRRAVRADRRRACLVLVTEPVARAALASGYTVVKIGEEPTVDLERWRRPTGKAGKTLRGHVNRARRAGVEVSEYRPAAGRDPALEAELQALQGEWERALGRDIPDSILQPAPLSELEHKRVFLARREGWLEAFVACCPVYATGGWLLEDFTRRSDGGSGASELLVLEALERLRTDGARSASLGLAPGRGVETQIDRRARWIGPLAAWALGRFDRHYGFDATAAYVEKFRPSAWEPRYAAFHPPWPSVGLVRGAIAALDP